MRRGLISPERNTTSHPIGLWKRSGIFRDWRRPSEKIAKPWGLVRKYYLPFLVFTPHVGHMRNTMSIQLQLFASSLPVSIGAMTLADMFEEWTSTHSPSRSHADRTARPNTNLSCWNFLIPFILVVHTLCIYHCNLFFDMTVRMRVHLQLVMRL